MAFQARQIPTDSPLPIPHTDLAGSPIIAPPTATPPLDGPIVSASALSTLVTPVTRIYPSANGTPEGTSVFESTVLITDSAQLVPTTSTIASSSNVPPTSTRAASTSVTSQAASKSSSANLSTLIPAIVAPVAVVMIISLALFWYIMRRRHRREVAQQPEFIMAGKGEKLAGSPDSSIRSGPQGLGKSIEAGVAVTGPAETALSPQLHLRRTSSHELKEFNSPNPFPPPQYTAEEIGVARPLTPADQRPSTSHSTTRPHSPQVVPPLTDLRGPPRPRPNPNLPRNFNRPGPPPGVGTMVVRDRSRSSPGNRPPGPPANRSPEQAHIPANPYPYNRPPTAPAPRMPWSGQSPHAPPAPSLSPTAQQALSPTAHLGFSPTANIAFSPQSSSIRSPRPAPIKAPPPTGAYNGGSAISQYSPIVKDHPPDARRHHPSPVDELEDTKPRSSHDQHPEERHANDDAVSDVSPEDDVDAKSDVSSLDEGALGRFDFERDLNSRSRRGSASRSGTGTPVGVGLGLGLGGGGGGRESPWSLAN